MDTLYGQINNKQYMSTSEPIGEKSRHETVAVFNTLTLKEKCLYLVKVSKRNTGFQVIGLMGLTLLIIATDYLLL
ncbi:hypothetical protein ABDB91_03315 [Desulfoscipio sp. XC116]|uniref:hypothetical protein n=1 Tax=Desulfoscipio sp. XC116 TaxID=3144975 RepID=UPI00325BAAB8